MEKEVFTSFLFLVADGTERRRITLTLMKVFFNGQEVTACPPPEMLEFRGHVKIPNEFPDFVRGLE